MKNILENKYTSVRWIDMKKRKVIVDVYENIISRDPTKEELKGLKEIPSKKELCTDKEYLIGYMKQFYLENRKVPACDDFSNNTRYPSFNTYINMFGSWKNAIKYAGLWKKRYNENHACDRCGKSFDDIEESGRHPLKEYDEKRNWTGNWDCKICYEKYDPNSHFNTLKLITNCRTDNITDNIRTGSEQEKGYQDVELVCRLYQYVDLNKKYATEIDCIDEETALLYQVEGRCYNSEYGRWNFGSLEKDWHKKYENMILVCKSEDGKLVKELYRIPSYEINGRKGICIYNNPTDNLDNPIIPWYEQYRVEDKEELSKANDIWKKILK